MRTATYMLSPQLSLPLSGARTHAHSHSHTWALGNGYMQITRARAQRMLKMRPPAVMRVLRPCDSHILEQTPTPVRGGSKCWGVVSMAMKHDTRAPSTPHYTAERAPNRVAADMWPDVITFVAANICLKWCYLMRVWSDLCTECLTKGCPCCCRGKRICKNAPMPRN